LLPKPEGYVERERRPRPERNGERRNANRNERRDNNRNERRNAGGHRQDNRPNNNQDYHDPMAEHEPKDFSDALDHGNDID
jgi:polyribonucleotide nucleotidyltransferase